MKLLTGPERNALLLALALLSGAGVAMAWRAHHGLPVAPAMVVTSPPTVQIADTLHHGETVSQLFERRGAPDVDWAALAKAVRNFDPSRVRSGTVFTFAQRHGEDKPHAVEVRVAYDTRLHMERTDSGWSARAETINWRSEPFVVTGSVRSSVSDAITESIGDDVLPRDARVQLVWSLADVYDWTLDFTRDIQPGDSFRVLAERMVSSEGEERFSQILAAEIVNGGKALYAFRFDDPDGKQEFYDENGRSLRREFLRAPLEFRRITSGFSLHRMHPLLGYSRAHLGIDFGAPYGTPIRSVGKGTVTFAGRDGGYGNLVKIQHNATTETRYAHMSAFGPGIHQGVQVDQGQVIGYVGASGLATGPHLHYELRINGRAVNPAHRQQTSPGVPVPADRRDEFARDKARLMDLLVMQPGSRLSD